MYCTTLYYIIMYYTVLTILYYTIMHCTLLYYTIMYYTVLTIPYYTLLYYSKYGVLYLTIIYYMIIYYSILLYNTLHILYCSLKVICSPVFTDYAVRLSLSRMAVLVWKQFSDVCSVQTKSLASANRFPHFKSRHL